MRTDVAAEQQVGVAFLRPSQVRHAALRLKPFSGEQQVLALLMHLPRLGPQEVQQVLALSKLVLKYLKLRRVLYWPFWL